VLCGPALQAADVPSVGVQQVESNEFGMARIA